MGTRRKRRERACTASLALALALSACGPQAQTAVRYPAVAVGGGAVFSVGEWTVTLQEARLAFGPVYFCAARTASAEQCEAALAELLSVTEIDLLSEEAQALGEVTGLSGTIRSATFDYGITWLTTEAAAMRRASFGRSARFLGTAQKGTSVITFSAELDVTPQNRGSRAVLLGRTGADVSSSNFELRVSFDAAAWWSAVDFDALAAGATNGDVVLAEGSDAANAVIIQMTANAPPLMRWVER